MKPILAPGGEVRGYIREIGSRKELLTAGGRVLGYYDCEKDQTYRPGAVFFGYGDQLLALLED